MMPAQRAPATVVITQRVRPGCEKAFGDWQDSVNRAVAAFSGFLGTEVLAADDGSGEWTIIYRFDSAARLEVWLGSGERHALLERGAELFAAPASQQVLVGEHADDTVAVVVSHPVAPGLEQEFLAWQERMTKLERTFPGFRDSELFRPVPGVQESWTIAYRFDTAAHLDHWLESPERQRMLDEGRHFSDFELHRVSRPFGSWFAGAGDGQETPAPAAWKTAVAVLVGLYPTVVILTLAIGGLWRSAPLWLSLLVGNIVSVALLTWLVMPIVTRALRFWLAPTAPGPRLDALGTVVSIAFLTLAAIVFWLVTTVVWTLP